MKNHLPGTIYILQSGQGKRRYQTLPAMLKPVSHFQHTQCIIFTSPVKMWRHPQNWKYMTSCGLDMCLWDMLAERHPNTLIAVLAFGKITTGYSISLFICH